MDRMVLDIVIGKIVDPVTGKLMLDIVSGIRALGIVSGKVA